MSDSQAPKGAVRRLSNLAGSTAPERSDSDRRFTALVIGIIIIGTLMIGWIRFDRQFVHPTLEESFAAQLNIHDCRDDSLLDPVGPASSSGLRWRDNGTLTIEPLDESEAGRNATIGKVVELAGGSLTDDGLSIGDATLSESGSDCDGQPAELQIHRWRGLSRTAEVITSDLASMRLDADGDTILIALAPAGTSFDRSFGNEIEEPASDEADAEQDDTEQDDAEQDGDG